MSGYCYKLQHKTNNDLMKYYGSTEDLNQRESDHKSSCNNPNSKEYNNQKNQYIREHEGWDNWEMIKIYQGEDYQLKEKEFIVSTWEININSYIPLQSKEDRREHNLKKAKERYHLNKDSINEKRKVKITCEICGFLSLKHHLPRHQKSKKCMEFNSDIHSH